MTISRTKDFCINSFKKFGILPFKTQYILALLLFVVKRDLFKTNYDSDNITT